MINKNDDNENFNIVGLPSLDDIEIEEPTKKPLGRGRGFQDELKKMEEEMKNLTPEKLKKMLPPELIKGLEEGLGSQENISSDEILKLSIQMMQNMKPDFSKLQQNMNDDDLMKSILNAFGLGDDIEEDEEQEQKEKGPAFFDRKWLYNNLFGSIPCLTSQNLYHEFTDKYGTDGEKYLDPKSGLKVKTTTVTENVPLDLVEELQYCFSTDRYILFYAKPFKSEEQKADPTLADFGFFMAAIKQETGDFAFIIPEYGNTLDYDEEDGCFVYDEAYGDENFLDNNGNFIKPLAAVLNFSVKFMLAPIKNILLSPLQFGTLKNQKVPVNGSSQWLQIGMITSNETPEAILFKKDADLDLHETSFPFYLRFAESTLEQNLRLLQDALYNTDLNQAPIFKYSELKFTTSGELYIDVDLSDLD